MTLQRYNLKNAKSSIGGYFLKLFSYAKADFQNIKASVVFCEGECFFGVNFVGAMTDGRWQFF